MVEQLSTKIEDTHISWPIIANCMTWIVGKELEAMARGHIAMFLYLYEYFVAPVWKRGLFLGFDQRSEAKIGGWRGNIGRVTSHTSR